MQGFITANGETEIPMMLTPMTIGPMHEIVHIAVAGVDDMMLVNKYFVCILVLFCIYNSDSGNRISVDTTEPLLMPQDC